MEALFYYSAVHRRRMAGGVSDHLLFPIPGAGDCRSVEFSCALLCRSCLFCCMAGTCSSLVAVCVAFYLYYRDHLVYSSVTSCDISYIGHWRCLSGRRRAPDFADILLFMEMCGRAPDTSIIVVSKRIGYIGAECVSAPFFVLVLLQSRSFLRFVDPILMGMGGFYWEKQVY